MIEIRRVTAEDAAWLESSFASRMGWVKPMGYFDKVMARQNRGEVVLLVAVDGDDYVGHCKVVWEPGYPYFREHNIPETQDLNVIPAYRREGVATRLMDMSEALIKERSDVAGIGFGLYADYGAAQRMYILRGYVPDGCGVCYDDEYPEPGSDLVLDDDLVLHLVKQL